MMMAEDEDNFQNRFWRKQVYFFRVLPSLLKTLFIAMMFYFSGRILLNVYLLLLSMCINGEEFLLLFIQKEKKAAY